MSITPILKCLLRPQSRCLLLVRGGEKLKFSIDEMEVIEKDCDPYKTPSLTMTAESFEEWVVLSDIYMSIIGYSDCQVSVVKKSEANRQIQIRIDQARSRFEEEEYYEY
jgi:hypothetical protein